MIKNYLSIKIILLVFSTLNLSSLCSYVYAKDNKEKIIPSTWAWKITGTNRTVYLLGEHHNFYLNSDTLVSHKLGMSIYKNSSKIWVEPIQIILGHVETSKELKQQIKAKTFQSAMEHTKKSISNYPELTDAEKYYLNSQYATNINNSDPITAYMKLSHLAFLTANAENLNYMHSQGLTTTLMNYEGVKTTKKLANIEKNTSVTSSWWKNCGSQDNAEKIINIALQKFSLNYLHEYDLAMLSQQQFIDYPNDAEKLLEMLLLHPEGKILQSCSLNQRNQEWMALVNDALSTNGEPVTFLVGAWHLGGEKGLLNLIRKEGYTNVKKIYAFE